MIEVRIEELVVTGFPLAHPERLAPAVESALAARLADTRYQVATRYMDVAARDTARYLVATRSGVLAPEGGVLELADAGVDELAGAVAASVDRAIRARREGTP